MLNVANWTDKQLDELTDMLRSADFSLVVPFLVNNFLVADDYPRGRILSDNPATTLTVVADATPQWADLKPGIFIHGASATTQKVSQVDTLQTCGILSGTAGVDVNWGNGEAAGDFSGNAGKDRYTIISVKNAEQLNTSESRWFVNDAVDPNTYAIASTYTKINKAYYDVVVTHGAYAAPGAAVVPDAPAGYWTICEIYIPHDAVSLATCTILDTRGTSYHLPTANWNTATRVYRMEYYGEFVPGTKVVFGQAFLPSGWTQVPGLDDKALRCVSTILAGGVGGSRGLSSANVGDHTLTIAEMPSHTHSYITWNYTDSGAFVEYEDNAYWWTNSTGATGGGGAHNHPLNLAYVDVMVCQKS